MTYLQFIAAIFGIAGTVMLIATFRLGKTVNAIINVIRGFCERTD